MITHYYTLLCAGNEPFPAQIDMNTRPRKVSVDMYLDLKFAVSGDPNLECIRQYQYQSSISINIYLNINPGVNPSPTGIGYL